MKNIVILFLMLLGAAATRAQMPQGAPAGKPGQGVPAIGHVYGKIVDSAGRPLSEVSVVLMQSKYDAATKKTKEVLLKGMVTKASGEFSFEELPLMGRLTLKITSTGLKALSLPVSFLPDAKAPAAGGSPAGGAPQPLAGGGPSTEKDLGKIRMENDVRQLQNVTVTARTPQVRLDADKKIFNVEKNIVSAGGTALDVMKTVPSVNVDIDGNVTLRNSSPQLYVDGRPTTLTLDQIPADAIESVEVITNPSAKYDASGGGAGILNIVLKKNRKTGYNGNLRAGVDKRGGINGGGDFNLRQGKVNLSASLMVNQMRSQTTGTTERTNLLDTPQTTVNQLNSNRTNGGFMFAKLGMDYLLSNRTTLTLNGFKVHGEFKPTESIDILTDSLFNTGKISSSSNRLSNSSRVFNGQGLALGFKHLFSTEGKEWTADANYFTGHSSNSSQYTTNYFATDGVVTGTDLQQVLGSGHDRNLVLQTDFTQPLGKSSKLEAGLRAALRSRTNINDNYLYDYTVENYVLVPSATSDYKNSDRVFAAYGTYSGVVRQFSYKLGLRAERSDYSGQLLNNGQTFGSSYPVSLFPSVFLTQKLGGNQQLQISYSRRINRPNFFQLIPFVDYTDKLNITKGNPNLVPEFTQSLEMSYLKTFAGNNTLLASVYYKHTDNLITRYLDQQTDPLTGSNILVNTYINANSSYTGGAELTSQDYITKWWDLSTNINVYNSRINTGAGTVQQDALWSWFGKFNSNFRLPAAFTVQLTATYQSKTNLPVNNNPGMGGPPMMQSQSASQGYIDASWGMDLAFKKTFLKDNAAAITLSINDIFRTRVSNQYSSSVYFVQQYNRLRDPQMIRLNFSYRFGKIDVSLFKRKNMKADQGSSDSMQQQ